MTNFSDNLTIKVTTPKDKAPLHMPLEKAIAVIEKTLGNMTDGASSYKVIFYDVPSQEDCKEIARLYTQAGWEHVKVEVPNVTMNEAPHTILYISTPT